MMRFLTVALSACLLCLFLAACGSDAPDAEAAGDPTPESERLDGEAMRGEMGTEDRMIREYELSMDVLRRFPAVYQNLAQVMQSDPDIVDRLETSDYESFDENLARLETEPAFRRAIEGAGISIRDYMLTTVAIAGAEMYSMFPEAYDERSRPPAQHLEFIERNRAEIEAISAELQAIEGEMDH